MDQRQNPRVRRALPVSVSSCGRPLGTFATRDLSIDGMFLACGPIDLRCDQPITLHVETSLAGIPMRATVVHRSEMGIGLRFERRYPDYVHDVLEVLEQIERYRWSKIAS